MVKCIFAMRFMSQIINCLAMKKVCFRWVIHFTLKCKSFLIFPPFGHLWMPPGFNATDSDLMAVSPRLKCISITYLSTHLTLIFEGFKNYVLAHSLLILDRNYWKLINQRFYPQGEPIRTHKQHFWEKITISINQPEICFTANPWKYVVKVYVFGRLTSAVK